MGIIDKIFKSQRDIAKEKFQEIPWHPLNDLDQVDVLLGESADRRVAVFKHSTRCGISRMVLKNFEQEYDPARHDEVRLYFLDLLAHREVSNKLADRLGVQHESPQLIVLKDKKVVHHASHHAVSVENLLA